MALHQSTYIAYGNNLAIAVKDVIVIPSTLSPLIKEHKLSLTILPKSVTPYATSYTA